MINRNYPFLVWILTIFFGPLSFLLYDYFSSTSNDFGWHFGMMLPALLYGCIFSFPILVVLLAGFHLVQKYTSQTYLMKLLSILIGVIGIIISFQLLGGYLAPSFTVFYSFAWILFGIIIPVKLKKEVITTEEQQDQSSER